MIEGPVLVTVVPANTANGVAVPNPTEDWACVDAVCVPATTPKITMAAVVPTASTPAPQRRVPPARAQLITDVTNCPQSINERLRPVSTLAKNWIAEN